MNTINIFVIAFIINAIAFGVYIKLSRQKWLSGMFNESTSLLTSPRSADFGFVCTVLGFIAFVIGLFLSTPLMFIGGFLISIFGQLLVCYTLGLYWGKGMFDALKLPGVWRVFAGFLFGLVAASFNIAWYFG